MPPFIPDVPYKIQAIFISVFFYIWSTAFVDDYLADVPADGEARTEILVRLIPVVNSIEGQLLARHYSHSLIYVFIQLPEPILR